MKYVYNVIAVLYCCYSINTQAVTPTAPTNTTESATSSLIPKNSLQLSKAATLRYYKSGLYPTIDTKSMTFTRDGLYLNIAIASTYQKKFTSYRKPFASRSSTYDMSLPEQPREIESFSIISKNKIAKFMTYNRYSQNGNLLALVDFHPSQPILSIYDTSNQSSAFLKYSGIWKNEKALGVDFSNDGETLVSGGIARKKGEIRVHNLTNPPTLSPQSKITVDGGGVYRVIFSPNNEWFAAVGDGFLLNIYSFNNNQPAAAPELLKSIKSHDRKKKEVSYRLAISPDSKWLAVLRLVKTEDPVLIYNMENPTDPRLLSSLKANKKVKCIDISHDGKILAIGTDKLTKNQVVFYDMTNSGNPTLLGSIDTNYTSSCAFNPAKNVFVVEEDKQTLAVYNYDLLAGVPTTLPTTNSEYTNEILVTDAVTPACGNTATPVKTSFITLFWGLLAYVAFNR